MGAKYDLRVCDLQVTGARITGDTVMDIQGLDVKDKLCRGQLHQVEDGVMEDEWGQVVEHLINHGNEPFSLFGRGND